MSKRSETRDPERSCKGRNEPSSSLAEEKVDPIVRRLCHKLVEKRGNRLRHGMIQHPSQDSQRRRKKRKKKGNAHSSRLSSLPTKRNWRRAGTSEKCRVKTRTKEQRVKSARGEGNGRRERT
jgi:hypothetical protein